MDLGIRGRRALVTGASRGLGRAIAVELSREGVSVAVVARGAQDLADARAEARAVTIVADLATADGCARACAEAIAALGGVDILVNNAGTADFGDFLEIDDERWAHTFAANLMSAVRCSRALLPSMLAAGWGRIINIASSAGKQGGARWPDYAASKAAMLGLSRSLADAFGRQGVRVNAICPGPLETPLWEADGALADRLSARTGKPRHEAMAELASAIPLGRFGRAEEVAALVAFIASDRASFVNGAALSVDGGNVRVII